MTKKGFSHIGLSTLDLDKTREFYEDILGFKPVRCDTIKIKEGGRIRHIFFDTGRDQLLAFMEAKDIPDVPVEYDAGINRGSVSRARSTISLLRPGQKRRSKKKNKSSRDKGVEVSEVVDHDWAKSIYFKDPNGMQMEYCCFTRDFHDEDAVMTERFEAPICRAWFGRDAGYRFHQSAELGSRTTPSIGATPGLPRASRRSSPRPGCAPPLLYTLAPLASDKTATG